MTADLSVMVAPGSCRWCGVDLRDHVQLWAAGVGWHGWVEPTAEQRKARMQARRARDAAAEAMWAYNEGINP